MAIKIMLNPGHGSTGSKSLYAENANIQNLVIPNSFSDPGACGNGLQEAERAAFVGKLVAKYLLNVGYNVILYQYDGLSDITNKANALNIDLFISIHCNAANGQAQGTETYSYYGSTKGARLASCIHNQIKSSLQIVNRGTKEAGFYVIKHTNVPAVLTELAFIDHPYDASLLQNKADNFARAIARGITDYFA